MITTDLKHIGMLRQWINEREKRLVTNEDILFWLSNLPEPSTGEEECSNCQNLKPGKIIDVDDDDNCLYCGKPVYPKPIEGTEIPKTKCCNAPMVVVCGEGGYCSKCMNPVSTKVSDYPKPTELTKIEKLDEYSFRNKSQDEINDILRRKQNQILTYLERVKGEND